jgi:hypothetical protein
MAKIGLTKYQAYTICGDWQKCMYMKNKIKIQNFKGNQNIN